MDEERKIEIIKGFFFYSFIDINFDYESLAEAEQKLCTKQEFEELVDWIRKNPPEA